MTFIDPQSLFFCRIFGHSMGTNVILNSVEGGTGNTHEFRGDASAPAARRRSGIPVYRPTSRRVQRSPCPSVRVRILCDGLETAEKSFAITQEQPRQSARKALKCDLDFSTCRFRLPPLICCAAMINLILPPSLSPSGRDRQSEEV